MSKVVTTVGRVIGGVIAGKAGAKARRQSNDPVVGAAVGAAAMFVAGKLLPRRLTGIGAALAAGYVARKLAQRADRIAVAAPSGQTPTPPTTGRRPGRPAKRTRS